MRSLQEAVDGAAEGTRFSGVVSLDLAGDTEFCKAYGVADRSHGILHTVRTRFAAASGSKGLTARAVMGLAERGTLALGMTARSLLGEDLPLIASDAVWLEGYDAGASFASLHQPLSSITYTVISNWSDGAWPIIKLLNDRLGI